MSNGFDWVPFYEEMANKLLAFRTDQPALVRVLQTSGVGGLQDQDPEGTWVALTEMDPFTFLTLLNKQSHAKRTQILEKVASQLGISAPVPTGFLGIPKADARQAWLFPYRFERNQGDVDKLWNLYEAVRSTKPLSEDVFAAAQSVKYTGHAKLTQAIFRAAPKRFFPVDKQTIGYLAGLRLPSTFNSAKEFQEICKLVSQRVSKPLYEQSHDAWYANQKQPNNEAEYQKIALQRAAKSTVLVEPSGGVPVPKIRKSGVGNAGYQRNPSVAATALVLADFKCEVDPRHQTFLSNAKGKPYVEAHHLIPFSNQANYAVSLDVTANIVALCPNCHRLMHHGQSHAKKQFLHSLLRIRKAKLAEKGLKIGESELMRLYSGDLLDEDS